MRNVLFLIFLGAAISAQAAESWLLQLDRWGNLSFMTLNLQDDGGKLSGTQDYGLSLSDSAVVLGSTAQYTVANLAGRSVGVAEK